LPNVLDERKNLVVKMGDDIIGNATTTNNYELSCDCVIVLGPTCKLCVALVGGNAKKFQINPSHKYLGMQFYDLHHCQYYQYICNVCGPIKEV